MSQPDSPAPKTAQLLQKLREKKLGSGGTGPRPEASIAARSGPGPWPLSFGQERMWLLDQLRPGSSAFNMPMALRLRGVFEVPQLEAALAELERRHESLRTVFVTRDGVPYQDILPPSFRLERADFSALPAAEREERLTAERGQFGAAPFDLARGPLFRARLLILAQADHLLLLNFHHSVFDGWSTGVFFRELRCLLEDLVAGRAFSLAEPAVQYADYALWQRQQLQGELLEKQLAYWRGQLAGAPPVLSLPIDRPRSPQAERRGAIEFLQIDAAVAAPLRQLAITSRSSLFPLLLGAFQVLLHRLSGQDDVSIGIPVVDRPRAELENTLGFFLNTLVIRSPVDGQLPFDELFRKTRDTVLAAREHQVVPFEKLVTELQPERSTSQTPFFQVLFNFANLPDQRFDLPGVEVELEEFSELGAKLDLNLYVFEAGEHLDLQLVYDADLFDRARMQELLRQYRHLLAQIAADPTRPAGHYSLRSPAAETHLPNPQAPLPADFRGTIAARFVENAARRPDHPALEDPATTWTYGQLETRSAAVAAQLAALGLGPGDVVALWAHRSAALVEGLLGILRAGAAFVVFDPVYPLARLLDYLELSQPKCLLTLPAAGPLPAQLEAELEKAGTRILSLPAAGFAPPEKDFVAPELGADDLAYVAFTSGSTGKPKAILGRHASLTAFLPFIAENFGLDASDRHSLLSALSHDPLHRDVLMPLYFGATLVIPDGEQLFSPGYLVSWVFEQRLSLLNLVPAMLQLLVHAPLYPTGGGPLQLPALRRVFTVGDVLQRADVDALYRLAPNATAINLYGSTETQRAVSYVVLPRSLDHLDPESELGTHGLLKASLPVGRGYDGVQLVLLNRQGGPTGVGEVGEIHMRSHYLARGYADPEQTREKFLANPWGTSPSDRLYKTGDLGRYLPDGQVEFLGRADFQVKIRGFRIELQEIEAALARIPAIDQTVVVVREDESGNKRLVAYYVPREGMPEPTVRELRTVLAENLPDYMVPATFVGLRALPLTQTGKLDRVALPPPPSVEETREYKAPTNAFEEELASLWADLLGRERVGADDNFFELGGHSLLATQVLSRIRDAFGVSLPLRTLFENPTVEGLAVALERCEKKELGEVPAIQPVPRDGRLPLSFSQQRLWFLDQLDPESSAYLLAGAAELRGRIDPETLQWALDQLTLRHEALRTRIVTEDGEGWQRIEPTTNLKLGRVDLRSLPRPEGLAEARRLAEAEARRPIPLDSENLLRLQLVELGDDLSWLLIAIHHIVSDGWSIGILLRELAELYAARTAGRAAKLEPLRLQPADVAVWERQWLQGEALKRQLQFWRQHLEGAPQALALATDFPRPEQQSFQGSRLPFVVPAGLAARLRRRSQEMGATLFMTLLTAYQVLLARLAGQSGVVVGTPIAHREHTELEGLIGFFANTLPLRLDLVPEAPFAEHVARLRRASLDAFAHQDLPFEKLVAELGVERDLARSPVFQALFALQNLEAQSAKLGEVELLPLEIELGRSQFDLYWALYDPHGEGDLAGFLEWNSDLFERRTVERHAGRLLGLLEQIAGDPQIPVGRLALEIEADRQLRQERLLSPPIAAPAKLVPHAVAANAATSPDKVAIGLEGEAAYTYTRLEALAGRLARQLRGHGAGPESIVGLSVGRLPSLVLAQLAIWKAGAAYLPLDPIYPADRLAYMLEDSGAAILVVDRRDEAAPAALREAAQVVIDLADFEAEAATPDEQEPWVPAALSEHSLAYVLYTSGSTGKPKGVMIEHGSLANFIAAMAEKPGLHAGDRLLSVTTMSFDISGLEIWLPLAAGARVDLARRESLQDPARLTAVLERCDATVVQATPATWRLLLDGGFAGRPGLKALCGGEALPAELADRLLAKVGELWNVYGPTETTIWSSTRKVEPGSALAVVPLGEPIRQTSFSLVDASGQPQPPGVPGELTIGGAGLARGYFGKKAMTAERFRPDPESALPGARRYHTGDLARLRLDGELEFLGRLDFQVKVRGFRIELGEIEAALLTHPEVAEAVVVARGDGPSGSRLVGYIRPVAGQKVEAPALQHHLREGLPEYMVPALFVFLDQFPLTPNGKVDRRALPAPETTATAEWREPATEAEKALARIWQEVLRVPKVGAEDHFFQLGGDSILAIQVVTRAREAGLDVRPKDLFLKSRLSTLAAGLQIVEGLDVSTRAQPASIEMKQGIEVIGDMSDLDLDDLLDTFGGG